MCPVFEINLAQNQQQKYLFQDTYSDTSTIEAGDPAARQIHTVEKLPECQENI